jgi:hypothetical protein
MVQASRYTALASSSIALVTLIPGLPESCMKQTCQPSSRSSTVMSVRTPPPCAYPPGYSSCGENCRQERVRPGTAASENAASPAGWPTGRRCRLSQAASSDEAGHAFRFEAGHLFQREAGRASDLKPATLGVVRQV